MKIKNGLDTADEQESPNRPTDGGTSSVKNGLRSQHGEAEVGDTEEAEHVEDDDESRQEEGLHIKGGGDSQVYNGHRWGLGCCHYVRQGAEEDTFRLKCS